MTRRASDLTNPDRVDVDAAIRRGQEQDRRAQQAAEEMTDRAREAHQQRREDTRPLRGGRD